MSLPRGILGMLLILAPALAGAAGAVPHARSFPGLPRVVLAWYAAARGEDSLDQQSLHTALRVTGLRPQTLAAESLARLDFSRLSLLVLPNAAARILGAAQSLRLARAVRQGLTVICDGASGLTRNLGVTIGPPVPVSRVRDHLFPGSGIRWADSPSVRLLEAYPRARSTIVFSSSGGLLAVLLRPGRGRCLVFAPLFDPVSGQGYARFPTLPELIVRELGIVPPVRRDGVDAYFDPGYRYDKTPEEMARLWKQRGIRAVHVAAWYWYAEHPYPYGELLKAAHRQGILCYAWLQWPYVGQGFWNRHPEWREKNGLLQDAHFFFLQLMDFQNQDCRRAALDDLGQLMRDDWDGIDMAEFSITGGAGEALEGPSRPDYFTGFSDVSRRGFRAVAGFDPAALFDSLSPHFWKRDTAGLNAFYRYRTRTSGDLLDLLMHSLDSLKRSSGPWWELMLTILDLTPHTETEHLLATDLRQVLGLVRAHGFTLQVEDLASEWSHPPERYERMGAVFREMTRGGPLAIDINVVPAHPSTQRGFPTDQAIGVELALQWEAATTHTPRVCFYAEQSVFPPDWDFLPYTFASRIGLARRGDSLLVDAPYSGRLTAGGPSGRWLLDGRRWEAGGPGSVLLPAGSHALRSLRGRRNVPGRMRLLDISDDLLDCTARPGSLVIEYRSPARCALTFSAPPDRVAVDGIDTGLASVRGDLGYVVLAPPGRHRLEAFGRGGGRRK